MSILKSGIESKAEVKVWAPGTTGTGDQEPATTNITDIAKPALPQYTGSITVPALPDSRIVIDQYLASLLTVVDSYNAPATTLNWDIEVQNAAGAYTSRITGSVASPTTGNVFDAAILDDGDVYAAGTAIGVKFFYWADNAAGVVISRVELRLRVGHNNNVSGDAIERAAHIDYSGFIGLQMLCGVDGAGSAVAYITQKDEIGAGAVGEPLFTRIDKQTGTTTYTSLPLIETGSGLDIGMSTSGGDANGMYFINRLVVIFQ